MKYGTLLLAGVPLLASFCLSLWNGARPTTLFQLLPVALGFVAVAIGLFVCSWQRRHIEETSFVAWLFLPLVLAFMLPQIGINIGYLARPVFFAQALPQLNRAVILFRANKLPLELPDPRLPTYLQQTHATLPRTLSRLPRTVTIQGENGHHQLVFVMESYFMTAFYAYIWCEDGKPPTQALRYSIDSSDHVTPRGDGWFEAVVNNGH